MDGRDCVSKADAWVLLAYEVNGCEDLKSKGGFEARYQVDGGFETVLLLLVECSDVFADFICKQ